MRDFGYFCCFRSFFYFQALTENNKARGVLVRSFISHPVFYGIPSIPLFPIIGNLAHSRGLLGGLFEGPRGAGRIAFRVTMRPAPRGREAGRRPRKGN
jgi:hypothetical protein